MAGPGPTAFAIVLEQFVSDVKRDEDTRSRFYTEVLSQLNSSSFDAASHDDSKKSSEKLPLLIKELDERQQRTSYTRRISERLNPLLTGLNQYIKACDIMIQAGPAAAALIYGGARIVLILAEKFRKCFEDVLSMMEKVGDLLQCYHKFAQAYETSADMQRLLVRTYKNIVSFWQKAAALFSRKAYKTLLSGIVKPLDAEWQRCHQDLEDDAKKVTMLAQATEADFRRERELQKAINQQGKLRLEIAKWIQAGQEEDKLDVRQNLRAHLEIRHDDSCEWLFQHPDMEKWLAMKQSTALWYSAAPGAGKTITSSALVRKLQDKGFKTATFFCSFNDLVRKKAINVLRSLALQLLSPSEPVPEKVKQLYEDDLENHCSKLSDMKAAIEVISALIKKQSRVHIIVDGLDECEDMGELLALLLPLSQTKTYGIVKWFFSSRPDFDIRASMRKQRIYELEASQDRLTDDIRKYVTDRLARKLNHDCEDCINHWTTSSEGNFLWVRLMMQILEGEGTTCDDEIEEELNKFPKNLAGCYMRTLSRLSSRPERHQQLARSIFLTLTNAAQPLRLSELSHCLSASKRPADFSIGSVPKPELIEDLCANLVLFDRSSQATEDDPLLKVAHKSIQDFFVQDPDTLQLPDERLRQYFVSSAQANLELGLSSLAYLSYNRYHVPQDVTTIVTMSEHSFLRHAATFWHLYLSNAEPSADLTSKVVEFMRSKACWTCVAVQSRVAPYLFARYTRGIGGYNLGATGPKPNAQCADDVHIGIPLPTWLDRKEYDTDGTRALVAFYDFVTEWHPVLNSHPEALNQCTMDGAWENILPGRGPWNHKRIKAFALPSLDTFPNALVDVQLNGGSPQALVLEHERSLGEVRTRWVSLNGKGEMAPSDKPVVVTPPICATLSAQSYIFSVESDMERGHWLIDTSRLTARYHSYGQAELGPAYTEFHAPERAIEKWHLVSKVTSNLKTSASTIFLHCSKDQRKISGTLSMQSSQESGYGSMASSDIDSDSDTSDDWDDTDQASSSHGMLIIRGTRTPTWHFWKSKVDVETPCAFHPTQNTAIWSASAHQLSTMDLESRKIHSTILPEPVDVQLSGISAMRKEFRFSEAGDMFYLLYTATISEASLKQTISLSSFASCDTKNPDCVLEQIAPTMSATYESARPIQHPLILTYWDSDYVYVTLPPLSCNAKLIRIPLPKSTSSSPSSSHGCHIQTLRDPIYFPYSTPYRNPQIKLLTRKPGKDIFFLGFDAEHSSTPEAKVLKPPAVMTWNIRSQKDWRNWSEEIDAKEKIFRESEDAYALLRGNFVDKERRFEVPVRSGLDWRRKAFLSCF